MEAVRTPVFSVLYNRIEATSWLTPFIESVSYVDHLEGESDGLELKLDERSGKWRNEWYPTKGDTLELTMGYDGCPVLPCGEFEIDEIELSGPPFVVTLRAVAAGVRKAIRSKNSRRFDGASLRDVAGKVAADNGLVLMGDVPAMDFKTLAQNRETDLGFLRRVAADYGVIFSVRGSKLIFHQVEALEARGAVATIEPGFCEAFSLRDKTRPGSTEHRSFSAEEKQVVETVLKGQGKGGGDVLRLRKRAESKGHSQRLAAVAMRTTKAHEHAGTITVFGDPRLMAGNALDLVTFGTALDGQYIITSSRHDASRSGGYKTEMEIRRVTMGGESAPGVKTESKARAMAKKLLAYYATYANFSYVKNAINILLATKPEFIQIRKQAIEDDFRAGKIDQRPALDLTTLADQIEKEGA